MSQESPDNPFESEQFRIKEWKAYHQYNILKLRNDLAFHRFKLNKIFKIIRTKYLSAKKIFEGKQLNELMKKRREDEKKEKERIEEKMKIKSNKQINENGGIKNDE